jgi:hypothetical protein
MGEKKQLNVRIPLELQEKIENDGRPKVEIVIEALELYFASKKQQDDSKNDISANNTASQNDSNEVIRMKTEIEFLRAKIDDLLKLLHQEQVLHIQTQHMLTAPQPAKKNWWQFWK